MIVHNADGIFAIRQGPWKWIEGVPVDEVTAGARKARQDQHRPQLYNLELDPAETKDVSAQHPEVVGLLGFAILSGLLFARFTRPTAKISFSRHAIIAPYGGFSPAQAR